MPPNNIRTLSSLEGYADSERHGKSPTVRQQAASASNASASSTHASTALPFKVCCIPNLANEQHATSLLMRVVREFQPILTRRGYNVVSISEMCCCNDGLDFEPNHRKRRIMSSNIWGYNQTTFGRGKKSHTIHIRLRHPSDHARLLPYEDVAGTLAHELSHCEHGPHNEAFYKLMDEILEEHATLMTSQLRLGGAPMAAFTGTGQSVGSVFGGTGNRLGGHAPHAPHARDLRGYTLGGDATFTAWMTPAEAAVAAAKARRRQQQIRLRGDHCCRPCTITIDDDYEEAADTKSSGIGGAKPRHRHNENTEPNSTRRTLSPTDFIDLTEDNECDYRVANQTLSEWSCHACTFRNRSLALSCDMCASERVNSP